MIEQISFVILHVLSHFSLYSENLLPLLRMILCKKYQRFIEQELLFILFKSIHSIKIVSVCHINEVFNVMVLFACMNKIVVTIYKVCD